MVILDDKRLIIALRNGDETAFDKLYHAYVRRLYAFVQKTAKSPSLAEDVVHDTFVTVWEKRAELDPRHSFQSFLFTIARNRLLNLIKRSEHEASILEELFEYANRDVWKGAEEDDTSEITALLNKAIEQLPERRKAIFNLSQKQGLTYREVATHLNISYSTVNSQMVKALRSIREYLENHADIILPVGLSWLLFSFHLFW